MGPVESFWVGTAPDVSFPALSGDLAVDVAVIGGGIVGLTTALLVKQSGRSVAVIEARRIGRQATGNSTAKVTSQHATIYAQLIKSHGRDGAQAYADANQAAVERVADLVQALAIDCDLERKPAYVFTCSDEQVPVLREEAEAARGLGLPAELATDLPLPFPVKLAMRFADQVQFHPCKYLAGLARHVAGDGCHVFENTRASDVESGDPVRVVTDRGVVSAGAVVVATHLPVISQGMYFAKAYPHSQPILAAAIDESVEPDGMFISIDTPVFSILRARHQGRLYLVAAGGHTKPGQTEELRQAMAELERNVHDNFSVREIAWRWTNQDYMPMDRVPFVGRPSAGDPLYVATGFHGWGLSNGTAAAMMLVDAIAGRANPWAALFDAGRVKPVASAPTFLSENVQVAKHLIAGYLARRPDGAAGLRPGEAAVLERDGAKVAAYRDATGTLHEVSAVCTHMKCVVAWNPLALTWDCPCHGSRFDPDGRVLEGPAVTPLASRAAARQDG